MSKDNQTEHMKQLGDRRVNIFFFFKVNGCDCNGDCRMASGGGLHSSTSYSSFSFAGSKPNVDSVGFENVYVIYNS